MTGEAKRSWCWSNLLAPRPRNVSWEQAGALLMAGTTAYAAARSVGLSAGNTVVVSGAPGWDRSRFNWPEMLGAKVIGLASDANRKWLTDHG
jgi:NADPH:quinone reductase-like Zn-dependent oxidoreductase